MGTALEMRDAVLKHLAGADALIMAAAVADYRPVALAPQKMKKGAATWSIELERNPDILEDARGMFVRVGFAAESEDLLKNAIEKVRKKSLDLIVANDITELDSGFGTDTNKVLLVDRAGNVEDLPLMSKYQVAHSILDRVSALLGRDTQN